MKISAIAIALVIAIFVTPANAAAAGRVPRIGYLVVSPLVDPPSAERAAFFEGLRDLGYVVEETDIIRTDLYLADELFMTGTAAHLTPVTEVDRRTVADGAIGPTSTP